MLLPSSVARLAVDPNRMETKSRLGSGVQVLAPLLLLHDSNETTASSQWPEEGKENRSNI